jgi:predicted phosphodiesterase
MQFWQRMERPKQNKVTLLLFGIAAAIIVGVCAFLLDWLGFAVYEKPFYLAMLILVLVITTVTFVAFIGQAARILRSRPKWDYQAWRSVQGIAVGWILGMALTGLVLTQFVFESTQLAYYARWAGKDNYGPYLAFGDDPATSMTVSWEARDRSTAMSLEWGTTDALGSEVETPAGRHHNVTLTGLSPGTTYYYRVPGFKEGDIHQFTTGPAAAQPFTFAAISDTQGPRTSFGTVAAAMANYEFDFITHSGDWVEEESNNFMWNEFFTHAGPLVARRPIMGVRGNHELYFDAQATNFRRLFDYQYIEDRETGGLYHSLNFSNAHFVFLDNFDNETYNKRNAFQTGTYMSTAQLEWLQADLSRNQGINWIFVFQHVSVFTSGDFYYNKLMEEQLLPIFYEYEVDAVFSGHDHNYEAFHTNRSETWGGIHWFNVAGGGGQLDTYIMDPLIQGKNAWPGVVHNASETPATEQYNTVNDQLYGELVHHFALVAVDGDECTVTVRRAGDESVMHTVTFAR